MAKIRRAVKRTLLIVGEGEAEKAFLKHLKALYSLGDPKVSIKSAGGKGPKNVINEAISTKDASGYDSAVVLLDTDIPWPPTIVKAAQRKNIILLGSDPCFEGLLLDILNDSRPTPNTSANCKKKAHPMLNGKATERESYCTLYTKEVLDSCTLIQITELIRLIQGK